MKKKIFWILFWLCLVGLIAYEVSRPAPVETAYSGAYSLEDDSFVFIAPNGGNELRYRTLSGQSGVLIPYGNRTYRGGKGWAERDMSFHTFRFTMGEDGRATALMWEQPGVSPVHAPIVRLPEEIITFRSGELTLRGKLVRPLGSTPAPAVVVVQAAENFSAVDRNFEPYLYAARGFATLIFDQRGTGKSHGKYTRNFRVQAGDVLAALKWLRDQPGIDTTRIHLVGFAEGGWIAPLAAARDADIRSVLIACGPTVSVGEADRWGYVRILRQKGFDDATIAKADRINAAISAIVDRRENRWGELSQMLDEARSEPWLGPLGRSHSLLGDVAATRVPLWMTRAEWWWKFGRGGPGHIDRLYDPLPAVAVLKSPSFWIFGGQDSRMPTDWSVEALNKLQKRGRPVDYMIYPEAEHGIMRFETMPKGWQHLLGYEPDYFKVQVDWLRRNSGM
ncbi:MAG TPA: alpha/beta fold hydrolase [Povalibacter sp.]